MKVNNLKSDLFKKFEKNANFDMAKIFAGSPAQSSSAGNSDVGDYCSSNASGANPDFSTYATGDPNPFSQTGGGGVGSGGYAPGN